MGQGGSVDLPDPLDAAPPGAGGGGAGGADDLLSQLAGDEIDRLLAEADVEREPASPPPATSANPAAAPAPPQHPAVHPATEPWHEPTASATPASPPPAVAANVLTSPPAPSPEPVPSGASGAPLTATTPQDDPSVTAELDEVFNQQTSAPSKPATPPPDFAGALDAAAAEAARKPVPPVTGDATPADSHAVAATADAGAGESTTSDERAGLDVAASEAADEGPPSLPVRVLELFNAPLNVLPDAVRDAVGVVAILTLVNAMAILLYVLLVRR